MTYIPKYQHVDVKRADNGITYHKILQIQRNKNTTLYFPSAKNVITLEKPYHLKNHESILGSEISNMIYNRNTIIDECFHLIIEYFIYQFSVTKDLEDSYSKTMRYSPTILENLGFERKDSHKATRLFTNVYNHGVFNETKSIMDANSPVFSIENSYAGNITLIYTANNEWIIRDFCHSNHVAKKEELIPKFIELSAYRRAYNEMFEIKSTKAEIVVSLDSGGAQVFTIDDDEMNIYENEFLDMLSKFWKQYPDSGVKFTN